MGRRTAALLLGVVLVLTGFPAGPPDAAAATRCTVTGTTVPTVIDVTSKGTYATVRGCRRQADGIYVQVLGRLPGRGRLQGRRQRGERAGGRRHDRHRSVLAAQRFGALADLGLARPWTVVTANHVWVDDSRPGYNVGRVPYRGSGIFRHVGTGGATAGCVSVSASTLVTLLRWQGSTARIVTR
jgi:hypothetical protein